MNRELNQKYKLFNYQLLKNLFLIFKIKIKKVFLKLNGDLNESGIRILNDDNKTVLKTSSVDSFIMAVPK